MVIHVHPPHAGINTIILGTFTLAVLKTRSTSFHGASTRERSSAESTKMRRGHRQIFGRSTRPERRVRPYFLVGTASLESLSTAVVASGAQLCSTCHRVPGDLRPCDCGFLCHRQAAPSDHSNPRIRDTRSPRPAAARARRGFSTYLGRLAMVGPAFRSLPVLRPPYRSGHGHARFEAGRQPRNGARAVSRAGRSGCRGSWWRGQSSPRWPEAAASPA